MHIEVSFLAVVSLVDMEYSLMFFFNLWLHFLHSYLLSFGVLALSFPLNPES